MEGEEGFARSIDRHWGEETPGWSQNAGYEAVAAVVPIVEEGQTIRKPEVEDVGFLVTKTDFYSVRGTWAGQEDWLAVPEDFYIAEVSDL